MKKYNSTLLPIIFLLIIFSSCNNFLDETPDNSIEVDSERKIKSLLLSAYPQILPGTLICELSSDNVDDNGTVWNQFDTRFESEVFHWQNISEKEADGVYYLWEEYYSSIAAANQALVSIELLGNPESLNSLKGEALICRAYCHFILVNIFCKAYGNNSSTDPGIPYMDKVENTVNPQYKRGTVKEVYQKIDADIEAALPLINDDTYMVPKYHFNKNAALAFATRFNLYYWDSENINNKADKVIKFASEVLTDEPTQLTRDWKKLYADTDLKTIPYNYISTKEKANLMLLQGYSIWGRTVGNSSDGSKYSFNANISDEIFFDGDKFWPWTSLHITKGLLTMNDYPKEYVIKMDEYFELVDPVIETGLPHVICPVFTTDETLLCRAEAYVLKKDYTNAIADIRSFMTNFSSMNPNLITTDLINATYGSIAYYKAETPTTKMKLNPDFTIENETQENLIHAILNLRRILTIHEGLRWHDIKRYKIQIYRRQLENRNYIRTTDILTKDDERRAIQLPIEIIMAGMEANKR